MDEKTQDNALTGGDERRERTRPMTNSSTEADLDDDRDLEAQRKETDFVGTPDIDHEEIEEAVPGHELDVELAKVNISWLPRSPRNRVLAKP
jgi:hypothetical protein